MPVTDVQETCTRKILLQVAASRYARHASFSYKLTCGCFSYKFFVRVSPALVKLVKLFRSATFTTNKGEYMYDLHLASSVVDFLQDRLSPFLAKGVTYFRMSAHE